MAHTTAKLANDAQWEVDKAKATDPNLAYSTRAGAAVAAASDYVASTYHATMGYMTSESANPMTDNVSAAGHAVKEAEHTVKGKVDEMERKNGAAPAGDRIAAGAREAGEKVAAKYHEGMKNAESSF